jgi:hypothetical protein
MPSVTGNIYCSGRATRIVWAVAVGVIALGGACSKKAPVVQAPPPPLEVPVVPPRLVGPVVVVEPPVPTAETPEPTPPRQHTPRPAVARGNENGTEPVVKVEPPPESAKPAETTPGGQPSTNGTNAQAGPAPLLRTDSADDESVAKGVRETLKRAEQNLNKVNYQALNPGAKAQHDTARRFIAQANDALKNRRLEFATFLAEKADRLSASLLK